MNNTEKQINTFQDELFHELSDFLSTQKARFPSDEILKIDLHCHDHNSDVPDELLGRILNLPETWTSSEQLMETLMKNDCDTLTITNHNNTRSCYELREKGIDILTGAEFSVTVPDFDIGIHVLAYGFTKDQEKMMMKVRKNVYAFQEFAFQNDIPTIWAHPLYHYSIKGTPPFSFFSKMLLVFERFEVLNGQRDTWQNMLVKVWLESITPEMIDTLASETGIDPLKYCRNPYKKSMSGGSDSHMGIFSGMTGTYLYIPELRKRLETSTRSELALEALREGRMAPYGSHQNSEKLTIAFLDYVCQIALYRTDPGMLRILLHKGSDQEKIIALLISNGFAELQRHKVTMNFVEVFHNSFLGKAPGFTKRLFVPRVYKPVFDDALKIAANYTSSSDRIVDNYKENIASIYHKLNSILFGRLNVKVEKIRQQENGMDITLNNLINHFEIPSEFRALLENTRKIATKPEDRMELPNIPDLLDGLSFPLLGSALILAAHFTSSRVLYTTRPLLQTFSEKIGKLEHPKKMLWLTDTFGDNNGVSMVLKSMHDEIKSRNLPIDIMVCSNTIEPDDHLIVMKPVAEYNLPLYREQSIRIPDYLEIHHIFHDGEYDRLICSTEGPMGLAALYLKNAYSVTSYFYLHTDWVMFAKKVLDLDRGNLNRFRRLLRAFYKSFDGLFVLNSDQAKWLTGREMGFEPETVHPTAHWADENFVPGKDSRKDFPGVQESDPVVLFAGRISHEKGVMELPEIVSGLKETFPNLKLIVAGTGPAENELREALPEAIFLGWVDHTELPGIYSSADLLILPSRFDTFSCVVLEALSCGLPVIACKTKGPKDIILEGTNGYLVNSNPEFIEKMNGFFRDKTTQAEFRENALRRAKQYNKEIIIKRFLQQVGLTGTVHPE
ncbi:MAG: glycosyltransferase [Bacteroidetes bacterium]|nr:glycosyltransferase [Bacteroidota bacterium]